MNTEPIGPFPPDENGCICPQDFTRPDCPTCSRDRHPTPLIPEWWLTYPDASYDD